MEERSYEMHQVVADVLRRDPAKLDLVVDWIEERLADPDYSMDSNGFQRCFAGVARSDT